MSKADEVIFGQAFEALFIHGLGPRTTPRLKERLRANGVNLDKLQPGYERALWAWSLEVAREEVYPDVPVDDGYFALGETVVAGFAQTFLGRALAGMAVVLGPKRMLARMTHNLRTAGNYNETRLTERPDGSFEFWLNEPVVNPHYCAGLIDAALKFAGAKQRQVEVRVQDHEGTTYDVRWE